MPKFAPIGLKLTALLPLFIFKISYFMIWFLSHTIKSYEQYSCIYLCIFYSALLLTILLFSFVKYFLQCSVGWKISCYSPFKCQKSHGKVSLKTTNPKYIKIRSGQNVTAMGWPKLHWVEMSHCDKPSFF
jgi:hypothetical protein